MTDNNVELLDKEIKSQIENLATLTAGSKEHSEAVDALVKLQRIDADNYKNRLEADEKYERRIADVELKDRELTLREKEFNKDIKLKERELALKDKELEMRSRELELNGNIADANLVDRKEQRKYDALSIAVRVGADVGITLLTIGSYTHLFNKGLKFEETGTIASSCMRNLLGKIKFGKK